MLNLIIHEIKTVPKQGMDTNFYLIKKLIKTNFEKHTKKFFNFIKLNSQKIEKSFCPLGALDRISVY
jgi:hypothetical protein